jgi:hypothetical protein
VPGYTMYALFYTPRFIPIAGLALRLTESARFWIVQPILIKMMKD